LFKPSAEELPEIRLTSTVKRVAAIDGSRLLPA
jgi:hypothetical protein